MVTMGSLQKVTIRLLLAALRPIYNPLWPPLLPKWELTTPDQNLHDKLRPNGARYHGGVWLQPISSFHQQYHGPIVVAPLPRCAVKNLLTHSPLPHKGTVKISMPSINLVVGFPHTFLSTIRSVRNNFPTSFTERFIFCKIEIQLKFKFILKIRPTENFSDFSVPQNPSWNVK